MHPFKTNKLIIALTSFFVALGFVVQAYGHEGGKIIVHNPWIREAPPNSPVLAAYMTIENHADKTKVLKSVSSSSFAKVELHMSMTKDGMAVMEQQNAVEIKSHESLTLEPGGMHIMLIRPKQPLKAGDEVGLVLQFADGTKSVVTAKVVKKTAQGHAGHDHENGHGDSHSNSHGNNHGENHGENHDQHHDDENHAHGNHGQ